MLTLGGRAFRLRIGVALAAASLLFSLPAVSEEASTSVASPAGPTDAQCENRWGQSTADDTCQNESVRADDWMCRVEADCLVTVTDPSSDDSSAPEYAYSST